MEQKKALAAEYGLDIESLDFSIDDLSVEELREKFEAMKEQPPLNQALILMTQVRAFALEGQFREELYGALDVRKSKRAGEWILAIGFGITIRTCLKFMQQMCLTGISTGSRILWTATTL